MADKPYSDTHPVAGTGLLRLSSIRPPLLAELLALYVIITAILYPIAAASP